jgi:hypothetical protein
MVRQLVKSLRVPKKTLLEFFVTFSRFEFALKACGFVKSGFSGNAEPDWNKFILMISKESDDNIKLILEKGKYIIEHPPKQLIIKDGKLDWREISKNNNNNITYLLKGIKRVRNNLFHGSKFIVSHLDITSRNKKLISCSLSVLREVVNLPGAQNLRSEFEYSEIAEE